jgi:hypothetical protein
MLSNRQGKGFLMRHDASRSPNQLDVLNTKVQDFFTATLIRSFSFEQRVSAS